MARSGVEVNRGLSPMLCIEENLDESRGKLKEKKKQYEAAQKNRSPFLIGSIEEVNEKISKLDSKLQSYTDLVIDSRTSDRVDEYSRMDPPSSAKGREMQQRRERENREVNCFAGIYAIKSTFLSRPSERMKNISKISMNPVKPSQQSKKDTGKPKFVELHQYPGYDSSELTPLPHDMSTLIVLTKVADAQNKLEKKPQYRPEFERLFYSPMSQAILQDTFWWLFLDKWQSSKHYQQKLFNRVAHNYVKLLTYAKHPQYRETFLKDYPSLLSQGVYAAFCSTFPDSYRLFNEGFKEDLIALVYEWVAGSRPAPRIWMSWNFDKLEPPGLKHREEIINQSKASKKDSSFNLDFLGEGAQSQYTGSQSTLNQIGSVSSMSSFGGGKRFQRNKKANKSQRKPSCLKASQSVPGSDNGVISQVARAQPKTTHSSLKATGSTSSSGLPDSALCEDLSPLRRVSVKTSQSTDNPIHPRESQSHQNDQLTPIREFEGDMDGIMNKDSKVSFALQTTRSRQIESHPLGKGADFVKSVFNMYGQSPLVAHFLRMKHLQADAGMHVRVQRTEVTNLPPLDAVTYRDMIKESFAGVREMEKKYNVLVKKGKEDSLRFIQQQKQQLAEQKRKEAALLSNKREVKRISDLIMLNYKKDQDSIGAGVDVAIETALAAID